MKLCSKLLVKAVAVDQFGQTFITDCELLETSLVADDHRHDPVHQLRAGDVIYLDGSPLVMSP